MRDQLESDPSFVVPLRASAQQLEYGQASSLHKGCLDKLSRHTPPKLKLRLIGLESF